MNEEALFMGRTSTDFQICATCRNWGGYRKPDAWKQWMDYNDGEEALCPNWMTEKRSESSCGQWQPVFTPR